MGSLRTANLGSKDSAYWGSNYPYPNLATCNSAIVSYKRLGAYNLRLGVFADSQTLFRPLLQANLISAVLVPIGHGIHAALDKSQGILLYAGLFQQGICLRAGV